MSIEAIVDKIIGDARKEAEKTKTEVVKKVQEIEKTGKANIEDVCFRILQKARDESIKKTERSKVSANMEFRKGELEEKQGVISLVFDQVLEGIQSFGKAEYQELIEPEFLKSEGVEEVIIPPDEKRIDDEFLSKVNKLLIHKGKNGNLKLSRERRPIPGGGFILKKGNIESNNAFGILVDSIRNQIEFRVSEILFQDIIPHNPPVSKATSQFAKGE